MRVFVQVVNTGSFAAASRALSLAPAVVTRAVAELEAHLGARLLHRTTRSLALTEAGRAYHEQAQRLLLDLDNADAAAGASAQRLRGTLRVLCPPAFAVHQLVPQLSAFCLAHPQIGLTLATPGPVDAADGQFDVSIVSIGQQTMQGEFVARMLARSDFVICAAPQYLHRHGRPEHPSELPQHEALLLDVQALRHELTLWRRASTNSGNEAERVVLPLPRAALASNHIETIHAAALAGLGIAGLPSFIARQALRDGRLQRLLPDWHAGSLSLHAAVPTRRQMPARSRALVEHLVQAFGGVDRDPWAEG